jgi:hypothetical protein
MVIAPRETEKSFNITVVEDSVLEHDEYLSMRLTSLVPNLTIVTPYGRQTNVTIKNDDSGMFSESNKNKISRNR